MPEWGTRVRGGEIGMSSSDVVAAYRLHAAHCIEIAQKSSDPKSKLVLLDMAQAWLKLAEQNNRISEAGALQA